MRAYIIKTMKIKLIIVAFILMAFTAENVLTQFGISAETANNYLFKAVSTDYVQFDKELIDKARSLPVSARVSCARLLVNLLREYTQSEAFINSYKKYRRERLAGKSHGFRLPRPSDLVNKTIDKVSNDGSASTALPADPAVLVRKRLKEFLEDSATVNFDAKLNGGVFTDPVYECKDQKWKMYYRAGKPVIEAAQDEIRKWLDRVGD